MIDYQEIGDVISEKKNKNNIIINQGIATYGKYFEFLDGNPNNENRLGMTVVIEDNKIRFPRKNEPPVGVICRAAVILNSTENHITGKYIRDEFGIIQTNQIDVYVHAVPNTITTTGSTKIELYQVGQVPDGIEIQEQNRTIVQIPQMNPFYDPNTSINLVQNSKQWACVCIIGSIPVLSGQTVNPHWIKLQEHETVIEYLIR